MNADTLKIKFDIDTEQLEKIIKEQIEFEANLIRKETAKDILQTLYDKCYESNPMSPDESIGHITPIDIVTLAKGYGVEVEE